MNITDSMEHWGFVLLAYGIVWSTIVLYIVLLKRRIQRTRADRTPAQGNTETKAHEST